MPTLTPFTKAAAGVLLPVLLTACVSAPGGGPSSKPSASTGQTGQDPSGQYVEGSPGDEITPPVVEIPEVKGSTASDFERAVALMQDGRPLEAEVLLLSITSEQPELAGPWINLGQIYVAQQQPEEARRAFEAAAQANPYNCTAHNELGLLSRVNGDFEAAEQHYKNCLTLVPGNSAAHLNLGILYELYLGRLADALVSYRQYQSLQNEEDRRVKGWVMDLERRLGV
ncbi:MAG: tetratricopeptide repeat protein [Pseudomonadota bacterium]